MRSLKMFSRHASLTAFAAFGAMLFTGGSAHAASCSPTGNYHTQTDGVFYFSNNPYGDEGQSSVGTCFVVNSVSGSTTSWYTQWNQPSGQNYNVYAYPEAIIQNQLGLPATVSSIKSIPVTWDFSFSGGGNYDVAYDAFTYSNSSGSGTPTSEILIYQYADVGQDGDNVGSFSTSGVTYTVYQSLPQKYSWTNHPVYTFVATSKKTSLSTNLQAFTSYMVGKGYLNSSNYMVQIDTGIEVHGSQGTGNLNTSKYSISVSK